MRTRVLLASIVLCAIMASPSFGTVILGNTGWAVDLLGDFNGEVYISQLPYDQGAKSGTVQVTDLSPIIIELDKVFRSPIFDNFGMGQICAIKFTLVDPTAAGYTSRIMIGDEIITNLTGRNWTDFHMVLSWGLDVQSPGASFDPRFLFSTGNGVNSFQNISFGGAYNNELNFNNGTIYNGGEFTPGNDASYVIINTNLEQGQSFILKEYPTIPEPATMSLLAVGGLLISRFRKNK